MDYKVTGLIRNGRWDNEKQDWELARVTPRFFPNAQLAFDYFEAHIVKGSLWRRNEDGERNEWSVEFTTGMTWPEGARGKSGVLHV